MVEEGERVGHLIVSIGFLFGLREPNIYQNLGDFTRNGDFTWRVSDCEELVGVTHGIGGAPART